MFRAKPEKMLKTLLTSLIGQKNIVRCKRAVNRSLRAMKGGGRRSKVAPSRIFSDSNCNVFFGYYDISPFDGHGERLLAIKTPPIMRSPLTGDIAKIGCFDLSCGEFDEIAETDTWCWQQGCRLQWFPSEDKDLVFFNCLLGGGYGSVVLDLCKKEKICEFRRPIYSISADGKWGLSLNFSRLQRLRPGYGYSILPDETIGKNESEEDGVWLVDLESNKEKLLFSIRDIANLDRADGMDGAEHYFNHLCFAPDSKTFMFFHLWDRGGKRRSRLVVSNIATAKVKVFGNDFNVSHYTWKNSNELVLTGTDSSKGFEYRLLNVENAVSRTLGSGKLISDGHPSLFRGDRMMLTDSYPDRYGERSLILFDMESGGKKILSAFYEPLDFTGELRCDLHPRLDSSEKKICIDFIHGKRRAIGIFEI